MQKPGLHFTVLLGMTLLSQPFVATAEPPDPPSHQKAVEGLDRQGKGKAGNENANKAMERNERELKGGADKSDKGGDKGKKD